MVVVAAVVVVVVVVDVVVVVVVVEVVVVLEVVVVVVVDGRVTKNHLILPGWFSYQLEGGAGAEAYNLTFVDSSGSVFVLDNTSNPPIDSFSLNFPSMSSTWLTLKLVQ